MKGKPVWYKLLAFGVIVLFIGMGVQPAIATIEQEEIISDVEPKNYLFQTIIDIASNPEIKELLEKYNPDLFKVDIDRGIYRKLFLRSPRLMCNTLFTKPSISVEYLDKCYNQGIEITDIIGEDKTLEILENVEVTDIKLFDELNNIISNDEELLSRIETLKEMNNEMNPILGYSIICSILEFLAMPWIFLLDLVYYLQDFIFISLFLTFIVAFIGFIPIGVIVVFALGFDCF